MVMGKAKTAKSGRGFGGIQRETRSLKAGQTRGAAAARGALTDISNQNFIPDDAQATKKVHDGNPSHTHPCAEEKLISFRTASIFSRKLKAATTWW